MGTITEVNVLLVDDEPVVRAGVAQALETAGFVVHRCHDGEEAIEWLRDHMAPDILVGDVHMPGIDGFELRRRARSMFGHLPVLLITGDPHIGTNPNDGTGSGPLLRKPFTRSTLLDAVARTIADGQKLTLLRSTTSRARR